MRLLSGDTDPLISPTEKDRKKEDEAGQNLNQSLVVPAVTLFPTIDSLSLLILGQYESSLEIKLSSIYTFINFDRTSKAPSHF